jgi:hypothetical protein
LIARITNLNHLREGDRVVFTHNHPWATHAGTVLGWEHVDLYNAKFPKVQLDTGHTVFVFSAKHVQKTGP